MGVWRSECTGSASQRIVIQSEPPDATSSTVAPRMHSWSLTPDVDVNTPTLGPLTAFPASGVGSSRPAPFRPVRSVARDASHWGAVQ
jgi:hypothetical protein